MQFPILPSMKISKQSDGVNGESFIETTQLPNLSFPTPYNHQERGGSRKTGLLNLSMRAFHKNWLGFFFPLVVSRKKGGEEGNN